MIKTKQDKDRKDMVHRNQEAFRKMMEERKQTDQNKLFAPKKRTNKSKTPGKSIKKPRKTTDENAGVDSQGQFNIDTVSGR